MIYLQIFGRLIVEEEGATAIEYALLASLIAAAIITTVGSFGAGINATFVEASTKLKAS